MLDFLKPKKKKRNTENVGEVKKATVIGAGVMGAQIAAQLANAGIEVRLLDILPNDVNADRNDRANQALALMQKMDPAPFMHPRNAKLITPGNTEDNIADISDSDWIIEAVIENPKVKSDLFKKVDKYRKPGSVVSSNTSTIPLNILTDGQSEQFAKDFLITHFFNPPRYMRLLELVGGEKTREDALATIEKVCDEKLGKEVVDAKDTPGFIANRIGTFWLEAALNEAEDTGISLEEADAVMGKPLGFPKTGVFGLMDLVGLDLMPHISASLLSTLPKDDAYSVANREHPQVDKMIADGYTGRKGKGGFYRLNVENGKKTKQVLDLASGEYKDAERPTPEASKAKNMRDVFETDDAAGKYAWSVMGKTLHYALSLVPEIADDISAVDEAMKNGYNWKFGPFEMADKLGTEWLAKKFEEDGMSVPPVLEKARGKSFYRTHNGELQQFRKKGFFQNLFFGPYDNVKAEGSVETLSDIKRRSEPVLKNDSASVWDVGDGVLALEFTSKMNALDPDILHMMNHAADLIEGSNGKYKGLVIHNEGSNFSVGANLSLALMAAKSGMYDQIEDIVKTGQETMMRLKYANFPVVAAPSGMALGGACETLLHSDAVQAHAETYAGLVEVGVGILPGWGGTKEFLTRAYKAFDGKNNPMNAIADAFQKIGTAQVGKSAELDRSMLIVGKNDRITMNKERLLDDAKNRVLELADGYTPPEPEYLELPGETAQIALALAVDGLYQSGQATWYDVVVSDHVAKVLSGGDKADIGSYVTEEQLLEIERRMFMELCHKPETVARIEKMMTEGKPLREGPHPDKLNAREIREQYGPKPEVLADIVPLTPEQVKEHKANWRTHFAETYKTPENAKLAAPSAGNADGNLFERAIDAIDNTKMELEVTLPDGVNDNDRAHLTEIFNKAAQTTVAKTRASLEQGATTAAAKMPDMMVRKFLKDNLSSTRAKFEQAKEPTNMEKEAARLGTLAAFSWLEKNLEPALHKKKKRAPQAKMG